MPLAPLVIRKKQISKNVTWTTQKTIQKPAIILDVYIKFITEHSKLQKNTTVLLLIGIWIVRRDKPIVAAHTITLVHISTTLHLPPTLLLTHYTGWSRTPLSVQMCSLRTHCTPPPQHTQGCTHTYLHHLPCRSLAEIIAQYNNSKAAPRCHFVMTHMRSLANSLWNIYSKDDQH